jgi:hypothetical protein
LYSSTAVEHDDAHFMSRATNWKVSLARGGCEERNAKVVWNARLSNLPVEKRKGPGFPQGPF